MTIGFLQVLRYFLLALLWLFFIYAARMVVVDVRRSGKRRAVDRDQRAEFVHLRVLEPRNQRGRQFEIRGDLTIGRSPACTIVLDDDSYASSVHARIFHDDEDLWLEDLGSKNGTFINDEQITEPVRVRRGDRLKVGGTIFETRR
jgi:pSer/pThr/pTyr-binding forkhead associated (FHA) protein